MQFALPYIWHKPIKFKILMVLFVEGLVMLISPTLSHRQQTAATVLGSTSIFNTLTILKYKLSDCHFFQESIYVHVVLCQLQSSLNRSNQCRHKFFCMPTINPQLVLMNSNLCKPKATIYNIVLNQQENILHF